MGIVSKAAVERLGADYATRPLGTGPYKFVSWQRNSRIVLEANPEYWKGQPRLSQVVFNIIPDNTTRAAALESGDVDLIHSPLSPQDVARLRSMRAHLKTIDNAHGGGAALPMATWYLREEILPLLYAHGGDPITRADRGRGGGGAGCRVDGL